MKGVSFLNWAHIPSKDFPVVVWGRLSREGRNTGLWLQLWSVATVHWQPRLVEQCAERIFLMRTGDSFVVLLWQKYRADRKEPTGVSRYPGKKKKIQGRKSPGFHRLSFLPGYPRSELYAMLLAKLVMSPEIAVLSEKVMVSYRSVASSSNSVSSRPPSLMLPLM